MLHCEAFNGISKQNDTWVVWSFTVILLFIFIRSHDCFLALIDCKHIFVLSILLRLESLNGNDVF